MRIPERCRFPEEALVAQAWPGGDPTECSENNVT